MRSASQTKTDAVRQDAKSTSPSIRTATIDRRAGRIEAQCAACPAARREDLTPNTRGEGRAQTIPLFLGRPDRLRRRRRNVSLQAHVDDDVSVVLVVVSDVEHQHGTTNGVSRPCAAIGRNRHRLIEARVGGVGIHAIAVGE